MIHPSAMATWLGLFDQALAHARWQSAWNALLDAAWVLPASEQQAVLSALAAWEQQAQLPDAAARLVAQRHTLQALADRLQPALRRHASQASGQAPMRLLAQGVAKRYRRGGFALGPLDVQLAPAEVVGLVGENGNGKTTLLRLLAADLAADAGRIDWGMAARDGHALRSQLAYIAQRPPKWGGRVMDHLLMAARSHGVTGPRMESQVELVLARLGLRAFRQHAWRQLSSGYKMRFELARALLGSPQVLLLDEPLANLDINAQQSLLGDLRDMARSPWRPMAVVLSSQQLYEVEKVADRVLFLHQGQPRQVADLLAHSAGCAIEFEAAVSVPELQAWLQTLPAHDWVQNGDTHIVSFHSGITADAFLRQVVVRRLPLSYFRDITHSTRRLFLQGGSMADYPPIKMDESDHTGQQKNQKAQS